MDYAEYNETTGEIVSWGVMDETSLAGQTVPIYIGVVDAATQYINVADGTLITRPTLASTWSKTSITADGTDQATITGLPNPTTVVFPRIEANAVTTPAQFNVTDGVLNLKAGAKGVYQITLKAFPYQDFTTVIYAT